MDLYQTHRAREEGISSEAGSKILIGHVDGYAFLMRAEGNNSSEIASPKQAVEEFKRIFEFYPKMILADRVYHSRDNKLWCATLVNLPVKLQTWLKVRFGKGCGEETDLIGTAIRRCR